MGVAMGGGQILFLTPACLILPLQGYDVSFLITNFHTEQLYKHKLVDFVVQVGRRRNVPTLTWPLTFPLRSL